MSFLQEQTICVRRRGERSNIRGKLVEKEGLEFTIEGSLQPENNLRLIRETFGSHIEGAIKIYTETELKTKGKDHDADIIKYQDREWEVGQIRRYDTVLPHYKITAILRNDER